MTGQTAEKQSNNTIAEFWQTANRFYEIKKVRQLLIELQDKNDYSVNRLLFALWFSQVFQQLINNSRLAPIIGALEKTEKSVNELRQTRRSFETCHRKPLLGNLNMARYHLVEAELSLEKEIQATLVTGLCDAKTNASNEISADSMDLLVNENIDRLCSDIQSPHFSNIQLLTNLWYKYLASEQP